MLEKKSKDLNASNKIALTSSGSIDCRHAARKITQYSPRLYHLFINMVEITQS